MKSSHKGRLRSDRSVTRAMLWWGLLLLWCGVIYYVSADPVFTADSTAQAFQHAAPVAAKPGLVERLNILVRKTGHAVGFGVLGAFAWAALSEWPKPRGVAFWAWLLATLYAVSDEWHQSWVPGRTGVAKDVLLDSVGAAVAVLLVAWLVPRLGRRWRPR